MSAQPRRFIAGGFVCASCLWLAGCAGPGLFNAGPDTPAFSNPAVSMQNAGDAIVIGKTSKAEVMAALGAATVINFDSGFEVWVYRAGSRAPAGTKAEYVVLFSPDGIVKKTRLRPAYPARS
jgi:transcription elongation factor